MVEVTVTPEVAAALGKLQETTGILDGQGKPLGIFTPQAVAEQDRLKSAFDLEEAERILADQRDLGRPLAEIWRDLNAQGTSR